MNEEGKHKIAYEMQMYEYQARQMQNTIQQIEQALQELMMSKEAVVNLENSKTALLPLGAGIFAKVEIKDSKKVIAAFSNGLFSEQDANAVLEKLDTDINIYSTELEKMSKEFQNLIQKLQDLSKNVQESEKE
ncbi:prefoldin subunit alpha [Candidatus Micrarchaeota archaeon]|nr:prefoldin subunit alpha [Candidatus Micrarchaeota archaeon]